jgi:ferrous iron transport protein A
MIAAAPTETVLPLELLRPRESAQLVELDGDESQVRRLSEMGLRIGATIQMVRPGAPCVLSLDGKRISLRLGDNVDVLVALQS